MSSIKRSQDVNLTPVTEAILDTLTQDGLSDSGPGDLLTPAAAVFLEAFGDRLLQCVCQGRTAVSKGDNLEEFNQSFLRLEEEIPTDKIRHAANTFLQATCYGKGALLFEAYTFLLGLEVFRKSLPAPIYRRLSERGMRFLGVVLPMISGELDRLGVDGVRLSMALLHLQQDPWDQSAVEVTTRAANMLEPIITGVRAEVMERLRPRPAAALQTEGQTGEQGGRGDEALKHKQVSADRPIAPHQEGQPAKGRPKSRKELPIVYYAYADERRRGILTAPDAPPSVKVVLPRQHLDVLLEFVDRKGNPIEPGPPKMLCKHAHVAVRARESGRAALRVVLGKMRRKAKLGLQGKRRVGALRLLVDAAQHDPKLGGRRLKFRLLPAPESQR